MQPRQFIEQIYSQLERLQIPKVKMKKRHISNIVYDEESGGFIIGNKMETRDGKNIRHIKPLTDLVWIACQANTLLSQGKTCTLRDIYYLAQNYGLKFRDQRESNQAIVDLETVLEMPREKFHIFPEERSEIFGDLTVEYTSPPEYRGRRVNLALHPDGTAIGPRLVTGNFHDCNVNKVIVIEKGAMFTRFLEEKVYRTYNALLIHTAGQPPRCTRLLIRRLNQELNLPIYIFNDADPWGLSIAITVIYGSVKSSHIPDLATPQAKWIGLYATDIERYSLPSEKLDEKDIKRLLSLQKDPRCQGELFQREIKHFLKQKRKCELEAFSRYGLTHIVDRYLPEKLQVEG